jgi:hypothetical protein
MNISNYAGSQTRFSHGLLAIILIDNVYVWIEIFRDKTGCVVKAFQKKLTLKILKKYLVFGL